MGNTLTCGAFARMNSARVAQARTLIEAKRSDFAVEIARQTALADTSWATMLAINAERKGVAPQAPRYRLLEQRAREHKAMYDTAQERLRRLQLQDKLLEQRLTTLVGDSDEADVVALLAHTAPLVGVVRPDRSGALKTLERAATLDSDAATAHEDVDRAMQDAVIGYAQDRQLAATTNLPTSASGDASSASIFDDIEALVPSGVEAPTPVPARPTYVPAPAAEPTRPMQNSMARGTATTPPTAPALASNTSATARRPLLNTEW